MAKAPQYEGFDSATPLGDAARILVGRLADDAFARLPAALHGEDVRAVHDARVALRRLRAAMHTFRTCFPRKRWKAQRRATRRIARALGGVRDADVHLATLRGALGGAEPRERSGITFAIDTLSARRRLALETFAIELSQFDREALVRTVGNSAAPNSSRFAALARSRPSSPQRLLGDA